MSDRKAPIRIAREHLVLEPKPEEALPVSVVDWNKMMNRLETIQDNSPWYEAIGWACLGFAGSSFLSLVSHCVAADFVHRTVDGEHINLACLIAFILFATLTLACGGIGWVSIHYARQHRKDKSALCREVREDMQSIKDRYFATPGPASTQN